ncbi:hypothetical protein HK096_001947, partial [Nowakowskiella sp. JEL0078]
MIPVRFLNPNDPTYGWAFAITAGLFYIEYHPSDPNAWENQHVSLFDEIQHNTVIIKPKPLPIQPQPDLKLWLQPVDFSSDFRKYQEDYVENTRLWAIGYVHRWLSERIHRKILWLNAGAGLGKTMIAWLICNKLPAGFVLAGKFFCNQRNDQRNSAKRVVCTIAFQLFELFPAVFEPHLTEIMNDEIEEAQQTRIVSILERPAEAFQKLIIEGLNKLPPQITRLVFVIDALDECDVQGSENRREILEVIESSRNLPDFVRLFITARPESDIWNSLHLVGSEILNPQDVDNR